MRLIDKNGTSIHYSTFSTDVLNRTAEIVSYKNYTDSITLSGEKEIPFEQINAGDSYSTGGTNCRTIFDGRDNRIIVSFPFYDSYDAYRGSFVFYVNANDFNRVLLAKKLITFGDTGNLVSGLDVESEKKNTDYKSGFVFGLPAVGKELGQNIKIPSLDGILYSVKADGETAESIAKKYEVDAENVANVNHVALDTSFSAGQSIFVPGAELDLITLQEINGDLFRKPIHGYYRISSYFGWRKSPFSSRRQFHGGIDMACPRGTNIYAAMEGTIVQQGYSNVYGNYIIIRHHSGYKTLYGHMSAFNTKYSVGSYVYSLMILPALS